MLKRLVGWVTLGLIVAMIVFVTYQFIPQTQQSIYTGGIRYGTQATEPAPWFGPLWFWRSLQYSVMLACWSVPVLMLLAGWRFLLLPYLNERERIYADPDTGLFPLIRQRRGTLWDRLMGRDTIVEEDPNKSPHAHRHLRFDHGMRVETHNAQTPDELMQITAGVLHTQATVARFANGGGNVTLEDLRRETAGLTEQARQLAARNEVLEQQLAMQVPALSDQSSTQHGIIQSVAQALEYTRANAGRIIVGQQQGGDHELAIVDFNRDPFLLVAGKSFSGKTTTTAFHVVAGALASGYGVVIFEPSNKSDWRKFGDHVGYHKINADNILNHMRMLLAEYKRRGAIIDEHNLAQWHERPDLLPPYMVVIEELGRTREELLLNPDSRQAKNDVQEFDAILSMLLKAGANTGLKLLCVDQYPNKYPGAMRGSFRALAYYMGDGRVINLPMSQRLRNTRLFDIGEVGSDGEPIFFQGWHTEKELANILAGIAAPAWPESFNHSNCARFEMPNSDFAASKDGDDVPRRREEWDPSTFDIEQRAIGPSDYDNPPQAIVDGIEYYKETGKWDEFAKAFFRLYPDARQVDLRMAMSHHGGNVDYNKIKGMGYIMYHTYSPNGKDYKKPSTE